MRTPIQGSSQYKLQMRLNMDRNCVWKHLKKGPSRYLYFSYFICLTVSLQIRYLVVRCHLKYIIESPHFFDSRQNKHLPNF